MRGARAGRAALGLLAAALLADPATARGAAMMTISSDAPVTSSTDTHPAPTPGLGGALAGFVNPDRYRVGPGDQIVILTWGPITRSQSVVVGPEGEVVIPEIGILNVSGRSLTEARELIRDRVRRTLRDVQVDVQLTHLRTFRVYLTGAVSHPGPLLATGTSRVADLLADSMLVADASRRNIEVRRNDGERFVVDLQRFEMTGEQDADVWLTEGDVIQVPFQLQWVGAWGAFAHPGELELGPRDSVSTLVRLAGGVLPSAIETGARLVRWRGAGARETLQVTLEGGAVTQGNTALRDGDQLFVLARPGYHEAMKVWVLGRVHREGAFPIQLGLTRLTDAIEAAGGFSEDADRTAVQLTRAPSLGRSDPEFDRLLRLSRSEMTSSEYEAFRARLAARSPDVRVDWTELEKGRQDLNPLLQDGDVIRVERRITA
ncbi:MAG TPA: polysaccharide biosynthesis/export family protein, partial [Polyangiaceae bacterium]|nr:polysaccharide biosynthesis/export family protein [Polyangiaceae bacterium]